MTGPDADARRMNTGEVAEMSAGPALAAGGHGPLGATGAVVAMAGCAGRVSSLLARRRLRQPADHVGTALTFADGTSAVVYRETVVAGARPAAPVVLVVGFRLRWVRGERGHRLFRRESLLNTALFAGFAGFGSKLWCAHDANGVYRGIYDWDGVAPAVDYVRALSWVLALVSDPESIRYAVLPGLRRDDVLADPTAVDGVAPPDPGDEWWRVREVRAP